MACLEKIFSVTKPIIGMVHFPPLPYTPEYNDEEGMENIISSARQDIYDNS